MKLTRIRVLTGKIRLRSGLHIGAGDTGMHIGGMDNPVVKHPHTGEPYIPGSSLKGKVRSLLELRSGLIAYTDKGAPVSPKVMEHPAVLGDAKLSAEAIAILKTFGSSGAEQDLAGKIGPTRVSFSDCYLDDDWKRHHAHLRGAWTEEKNETAINRISGTAQTGTLRQSERVPEGTEFAFSLSFKVLQEGDEKLFEDFLLHGLRLLEMDALGGSGSRGYGRVEFLDLLCDAEPIQERFDALSLF